MLHYFSVVQLTVEFIDSQKVIGYIFIGFYLAMGKIHENMLLQVLLSLHLSGEDGRINYKVSTA